MAASTKKARFQHPNYTGKDGIVEADNQREAAELAAAGYRRLDGDGPKVAPDAGTAQNTKGETKS